MAKGDVGSREGFSEGKILFLNTDVTIALIDSKQKGKKMMMQQVEEKIGKSVFVGKQKGMRANLLVEGQPQEQRQFIHSIFFRVPMETDNSLKIQ